MAHHIVYLLCRLLEFLLIGLIFGCSMWLTCCAACLPRFVD